MKYTPLALLVLVLLAAACAPAVTPISNDPSQGVTSPTEIPIMENPTANIPPPGKYPIITPLPQKTDNTLPRHGDRLLDAVYFDSISLLTMESFPPQFSLAVTGNLPTPCHKLVYEVKPPDDENKIIVETNAQSDGGMACTEVLQPFSTTIPLGSFPAGHYTVWINGKQVAEFDGR